MKNNLNMILERYKWDKYKHMSDLTKELPTYYIIKFLNGEEIVCSLKQADKPIIKIIKAPKIYQL